MSAAEVLPATFATADRAAEWSRHLRDDLVEVVDIVPAKTPGRFQVKIRRHRTDKAT